MSDTVHLVAPRAKDAVGTFVQRRETFTAYDITRYLRANLTVSVDHNYAVRPVVHAEMQQHLDSKAYTRVLKDYPGLKDHDLDGEIETGKVYEAPRDMKRLKAAPDGFDSVQGIAGRTLSWGGPAKLAYDEFVVYRREQQSVDLVVELQ